MVREFVQQTINSMLLSEQLVAPQQMPQPLPTAPNEQDPTTMAQASGADPMAAASTTTDPLGGMDVGGDQPDDSQEDDGGEEEDTGSEEAIPEDPTQGIVDKVKEEMNNDTTQNPNILINVAKAYLQDYGLLSPDKLQSAKSVIQKLRDENIPDLNIVANSLEKFLS